MNYKLRWIDVWNRVGPRFELEKDRKLSIIQQAHKDWMENAQESGRNAATGGSDAPSRQRDGQDYRQVEALYDDRLLNDTVVINGKEDRK